MKQIFPLLIIAVLTISCNSHENSLEESHIKGNVRKIQETRYYGEGTVENYKLGDKSDYGNGLYLYNEKGYLFEKQSFDESGNPNYITKYKYNEDDVLTEEDLYQADELVNKTEYSLEKGKATEVKLFDKNLKVSSVSKYIYSGKNISNGTILNGDGNVKSTFNCKYSNGLLTTQTVNDSLGKISVVVKYKWNNKKYLTELLVIYTDDTSEYKTTYAYEYDSKGNWIKQIQLDEGEVDNIIIRKISYSDDTKNNKSGDIIGMWFVVDENDWIELRKDKKYDSGYKDEINESGSWEIDKKQQLLTFRATEPGDSKKYKYAFEENQLVFYTIQGEEIMRLEKK